MHFLYWAEVKNQSFPAALRRAIFLRPLRGAKKSVIACFDVTLSDVGLRLKFAQTVGEKMGNDLWAGKRFDEPAAGVEQEFAHRPNLLLHGADDALVRDCFLC